MTYTEQIKSILEKSGVDTSALPDNLYSTLLNALLNAEMGGGGLTREEVEKIVTDEVAKIVADAPEDFDTLKEMSDWISQHEDSAAAMNSAIQQNATDISDNTSAIQTNANNIAKNETNISTLKKHVTGELTDSDFQEDSTAVSVKTVPSGMSNYAAISKIGGKTQKVVQLISDRKTWTNGSTVDSKTFVMPIIYSRANTSSTTNIEQLDASSTSATGLYQRRFKATQNANAIYIKHNGTSKDIPIANNEASIVANHSYIFSCNIVTNNPSAANGLSMTNIMLFDITAMGLSESITFAEFNQVFSSYVPYCSYLWNTPVESVVSRGKNMFDKNLLTNTKLIENGFVITGGSSTKYVYTDDFKANTSYTISCKTRNTKSGDNYRLCVEYTDGTTSGDELLNAGTTLDTKKVTTPSTKTVKRLFTNFSNNAGGSAEIVDLMIIEGTTEPSTYIAPNKTTLLIPEAIKNLPDYGCAVSDTIYNWVDFENGVYHHVVGSVDLGSLTFYKSASYYGGFTAQITNKKAGFNIICGRYSSYGSSWYWVNLDSIPDKSVGGNNESTYGKDVYFKDTSFGDSTAEQFKAAMSGVKLVYELATEELIYISDILHPIRVETGGTITLQNEHSLDMPNTVVYKKEVSLS